MTHANECITGYRFNSTEYHLPQTRDFVTAFKINYDI